MYASRSLLTAFYAVFTGNIRTSSPNNFQNWQLNRKAIVYLAAIGQFYLPGFELPNDERTLSTVDRTICNQLALSPELTDLVVKELYRAFVLRFLRDYLILYLLLLSEYVTLKQCNELYKILHKESLSTDRNYPLWSNFIHYTSVRLTCNLWHRLPPYLQTDLTLNLLEISGLFDPLRLFKNFNPNYESNLYALLNKIERYTYRTLRNFVYGEIRRGEIYFGLSDLGVINNSYSSISQIRKVLDPNGSSDRVEIYIIVASVLKNYDKRVDLLKDSDWINIQTNIQQEYENLSNSLEELSQLSLADIKRIINGKVSDNPVWLKNIARAILKKYLKQLDLSINKLEESHWTNFCNKCQRIINLLAYKLQELSIAEIKEDYTFIANYLRQSTVIKIKDIDPPPMENLPYTTDDASSAEELNEMMKSYGCLFPIVKKEILQLNPTDLDIIILTYRDGLKQEQIVPKVNKDQGNISKILRKIEKKILKQIHISIEHPDEMQGKINEKSLDAMRTILKLFFKFQDIS
ncbi:hypothetical protein [Chamaesiphon sp. VAR_48_metabat_403]|uniref:hypothetical protein n=1 Tax=Chamaesiphon sp. VAR_48_metabat_403 TaxID=2964700 RepID=UPI00286D91A4|nr:hypothetical protein [Chamaesiphon sp. VAR_48_metabat_403]